MLSLIIFTGIYVYLIFWVFLPFWRFDQAQYWDSAVHLFAAWFTRNYTFPDFTGWNPFFFAGYPQDTFYGPLFHYIVAMLAFPLNLLTAYKLTYIIIMSALPFSYYYFCRKFGFNRDESSLMTLLMMFVAATLSLACGGTVYSLFFVGLAPHALAMPIYFIYAGKLKELCADLTNQESSTFMAKSLASLTLLAVLLVMTHFVVIFAALVTAVLIVCFHLNARTLIFAAKHAILTALCSSFFLLPLIFYVTGVKDDATILSMGFFLTLPLVLLIVFGAVAVALDRDNRFDHLLLMLTSLFAIMVFIDFGHVGLPMDAYRFIFFFLSFAMMLPAKLVLNNIKEKTAKAALLVIFIVLLAAQLAILWLPNKRADINRNKLYMHENLNLPVKSAISLKKLDGRILLLEKPDRAAPHALAHLLARQTGNYFLKGTFAESSANAPASLAIQNKLSNMFFSGRPIKKEDWLVMVKLFNLFQINYLLSEFPISGFKDGQKIEILSGRPAYLLYKIGDSKIAELLPYSPLVREQNWKDLAWLWLNNTEPRIVARANVLPPNFAQKNDLVAIIQSSPARLSLDVKARQAVPILIKIAYSPRWQASENGKTIEIYEVAPSLMLVYGRGKIELEYGKAIIDYTGYILTLAGLFWLIWEIKKAAKKHLTN